MRDVKIRFLVGGVPVDAAVALKAYNASWTERVRRNPEVWRRRQRELFGDTPSRVFMQRRQHLLPTGSLRLEDRAPRPRRRSARARARAPSREPREPEPDLAALRAIDPEAFRALLERVGL